MSSRASPTSSQTVAVHSQEPGESLSLPTSRGRQRVGSPKANGRGGACAAKGRAKKNAELKSTVRTKSRQAASGVSPHTRSRQRGQTGRATALLHLLTIDVLRANLFCLKKSAAPGVDEMTRTE